MVLCLGSLASSGQVQKPLLKTLKWGGGSKPLSELLSPFLLQALLSGMQGNRVNQSVWLGTSYLTTRASVSPFVR